MALVDRRFPPPWSIEDLAAAFVAKESSAASHTADCVAVDVAKGQRVWPRGNAHRRLALCLAELLDASPSCGNVGLGLCVISITHVAITARGSEMTYLSHVVTQRPMLRVSGQILLAFCCATPLVLLLCFLV
jgi:hypothetical protein